MEIRCYDLPVAPSVLLTAFRDQPNCFLLESSMRQSQRGRYSYFGYDPFLIVKGNDIQALAHLKKEYQYFCCFLKKSALTFSAGIVGYLSYDFGLQFESIKNRSSRSGLSVGHVAGLPGFAFGFYDCVLTIDHLKKKLVVSSTGLPEKNLLLRQKRARARLQHVEKTLAYLSLSTPSPFQEDYQLKSFKSNFSQAGYCNAVKKALNYIKRGDIYQVNLAQEFTGRFNRVVDAVRLYQSLCQLSPSCFSGYLDCGSEQIVSSSPEMFLSLRKGMVETRPMKGTRPRGNTPDDDRRRRLELQHNAKEKAELLMVTDLERNDLGRVCDFGSLQVKKIREIEKYRTVYQATATVSGALAKNKNAFDLMQACFPSGSVTGCPKIRAMQIIEQLEPSSRGVYTGTLGYLSFSGDMALNVLIRTLLVRGTTVGFHVGSGIVADSRPDLEYEETLVKAKALKESLISLCAPGSKI